MKRSISIRAIATMIIGLIAGLIYWLNHPKSDALMFSVLGGVLASVSFEIVLLIIDLIDYLLNRQSLISTFGPDIFSNDFILAYASFYTSAIAQNVLTLAHIQMPYVAADEMQANPSVFFRVHEATASHDLRALTYLATELAKDGAKPLIRRAADIIQPFDLSFVAFGLGGSQKARQLLEQINRFGFELAAIEPGGGLNLRRSQTHAPLALQRDGEVVGYIIRIHPIQFSARTWFLCAGIGPDGTIAAAFYLSRHFKNINKLKASDNKKLGKRACIIVVRSKPALEESAIADAPIPLEQI